MYRLARELLRRGRGQKTTDDLPRSLDALCLSPIRTIGHATVRPRAKSAGSFLVRDNNRATKRASTNTSIPRRFVAGELSRERVVRLEVRRQKTETIRIGLPRS